MEYRKPDLSHWSGRKILAMFGFLQREIIDRQQRGVFPLMCSELFEAVHSLPDCRRAVVDAGFTPEPVWGGSGGVFCARLSAIRCDTHAVQSKSYEELPT